MSEVGKGPQWCELGDHAAPRVQPCSFDDKRILMGCSACRGVFKRTKAQWGGEQFQMYWRLYSSIPEDTRTKAGKQPWVLVNVKKKDIVKLRAKGYLVRKVRVDD
jgi:hypothetical protein